MPVQDLYSHGDWNTICDVCGRKYKNSDLRKRWDNLMVCVYDYEERQPQDFVRAATDRMSVPWSRPEPSDEFIYFCTLYNIIAYAGVAVSGCAIAGRTGELVPQPAD